MKKLNAFTLVLLISCTSLWAQNVVIPDAKLKSILTNDPAIDLNQDGEIEVNEALITMELDIDEPIKDANGLEAFVNLEKLNIQTDSLNALNLAAFTNLETLNMFCADPIISPLNQLDLSNNPMLKRLYISNTKLITLNLSNQFELTNLELSGNPFLEELDLRNNAKLRQFFAFKAPFKNINFPRPCVISDFRTSNSQFERIDLNMFKAPFVNIEFLQSELKKLDISNNPNIEILNTRNSPNLTTICIDTVVNVSTQFYVDAHTTISETCQPDSFSVVFFKDPILENQLLQDASIDVNSDGKIQYSEAGSVTELNLSGYIKNFTGIEAFSNLETLIAKNDSILYIDLSNNRKLKKLELPGYNTTLKSSLSGIDLTNNTQLERLYITHTKMMSIDLSQQTELKDLELSFNPYLDSLNLTNSLELVQLFLFDNPLESLTFPKSEDLDDVRIRGSQLASLDLTNLVAEGYNKEGISFELLSDSKIEKIDISNNANLHTVVVRNSPLLYKMCIDSVMNKDTKIYVDAQVDVSEDCSDAPVVYIPDPVFKNDLLANLNFNKNGDGEIQLHEATTIDSLRIGTTAIKDLTGIEAFSNLEYLMLLTTSVDSINLSQNLKLEIAILLSNNKLTKVDLSKNNVLKEIAVHGPLTALELPISSTVERIFVGGTKLNTLDLSALSSNQLNVTLSSNEFITELDIQAVSGLSDLTTTGSPELTLVCINPAYHSATNFNIDNHTVVSDNCVLSTFESNESERWISVYPNPVQATLYVGASEDIQSLKVINVSGQLIIESKNASEGVDVSNLPIGIYVVEINTKGKIYQEKFVKQ